MRLYSPLFFNWICSLLSKQRNATDWHLGLYPLILSQCYTIRHSKWCKFHVSSQSTQMSLIVPCWCRVSPPFGWSVFICMTFVIVKFCGLNIVLMWNFMQRNVPLWGVNVISEFVAWSVCVPSLYLPFVMVTYTFVWLQLVFFPSHFWMFIHIVFSIVVNWII